ncbi:nitroreductase family protein [bacterium]|nr:nitroreductase family protein [bacterium]
MFIELLRNRRSVRKYQDKPVEKEKLDLIVEAMLRAPSSRGFNPWEFIIVDDPVMLEKLSRSKSHGSSFLKDAPLGIVVCADNTVDTWVEDCSIAATFIKLTAESLGLKSCWIQIRDRDHSDYKSARDYIAELLGVPSNLNIEVIISIGYANEEKAGHPKEKLQYEKVKHNAYQQDYV